MAVESGPSVADDEQSPFRPTPGNHFSETRQVITTVQDMTERFQTATVEVARLTHAVPAECQKQVAAIQEKGANSRFRLGVAASALIIAFVIVVAVLRLDGGELVSVLTSVGIATSAAGAGTAGLTAFLKHRKPPAA